MSVFTKVFGTHSQHEVKRVMSIVDKIDALAAEYEELSDDELRAKTPEFKKRLAAGETLDNLMVEAAKLLKVIGDFERISDHAVNLLESAEEMKEKQIIFTQAGERELAVISSAVNEILDLGIASFLNDDIATASKVEPLEQVIEDLTEELRTYHIVRLQRGECSIDAGFIWSDLITNLKRTSDHCSNIAGCIIDTAHNNMNLHESLKKFRNDSPEFKDKYGEYVKKYSLMGHK